MPEAKALIQPMQVERDTSGCWTHPAWPSTDDELIPFAWFTDRGLEIHQRYFEGDAPEELQAAWFLNGIPDCSAWTPSKPAGDGWFIFSIHDTEDGPICVWVRPLVTP